MKTDLEYLENYYDKIFKGGDEIGCGCEIPHLHPEMDNVLEKVDPELFGSVSPLPPDLDGCTVLDLGCGIGRTVFAAALLVGVKGRVIGVDPREGLLEVAGKKLPEIMEKFCYKKSNVEFKKGYLEDLSSLGIEDNSVDVVVANEIINLSPDKKAIFSDIFRVLKPGGELFFSVIVADRRVPERLLDDPLMVRACLAGAMYFNDFRRLLRDIGCHDYRTICEQPVSKCDLDWAVRVGLTAFSHRVVRTFKLPLEDVCEDYGQVAIYRGTMSGFAEGFPLDDHHLFIKDKPMLVCGNSGAMVKESRFGKYFTVLGETSLHYGPFDCS